MVHRGPIPAPVHGTQRIIERLVAADHHRRRRGDKERNSRSGSGTRVHVGGERNGERGVVRRDVSIKVERSGVEFAVRFVLRLG